MVSYEPGQLAVADTTYNRVLFWHIPPTAGIFDPADAVIGQPDFASNDEIGGKSRP